MYIEDYSAYINGVLKKLKYKKNIVVFGAGETAVKMLRYTDLLQYNINFIVDNKVGGKFFGKIIRKPSEINWIKIDVVIIAAFKSNALEIERELREEFCYKNEILNWEKEDAEKPFINYISENEIRASDNAVETLAHNECLHDIHRNQRLFILCNGPSVIKMNLKKLQNEISMAVSNFYMHPDYDIINPKYYCLAQFGEYSEDVGIKWLKEISDKVKSALFFLSIREKQMVEENAIISPNRVHYVQYGRWNPDVDDIDLCQKIMPIQSIPILCLQVAIYMGFKEIYLIGTEYDSIFTGKYEYFYNRAKNIVGSMDRSVGSIDNKLISSLSENISIYNYLWEQFKRMKYIAEKKNIKIFNATKGGVLDVFERVDYDKLF